MEKHTWNKDWPCACILLVIRWWSQQHYSSQTTACASDEVLSSVVQAPRWCRGFELAMKCLATCCSAPVPLLLRFHCRPPPSPSLPPPPSPAPHHCRVTTLPSFLLPWPCCCCDGWGGTCNIWIWWRCSRSDDPHIGSDGPFNCN